MLTLFYNRITLYIQAAFSGRPKCLNNNTNIILAWNAIQRFRNIPGRWQPPEAPAIAERKE